MSTMKKADEEKVKNVTSTKVVSIGSRASTLESIHRECWVVYVIMLEGVLIAAHKMSVPGTYR